MAFDNKDFEHLYSTVSDIPEEIIKRLQKDQKRLEKSMAGQKKLEKPQTDSSLPAHVEFSLGNPCRDVLYHVDVMKIMVPIKELSGEHRGEIVFYFNSGKNLEMMEYIITEHPTLNLSKYMQYTRKVRLVYDCVHLRRQDAFKDIVQFELAKVHSDDGDKWVYRNLSTPKMEQYTESNTLRRRTLFYQIRREHRG